MLGQVDVSQEETYASKWAQAVLSSPINLDAMLTKYGSNIIVVLAFTICKDNIRCMNNYQTLFAGNLSLIKRCCETNNSKIICTNYLNCNLKFTSWM